MTSPHLLEHTAALLTTTFVTGLWQGTALVLLAMALLRMMPRASASVRHALLVASFGVALVLPWLRFHTSGAAVAPATHVPPIASWIAAGIAAVWFAAATGRALQLAAAWLHLRRVRLGAVPIELNGVMSFDAGRRRALLCASPEVGSPTVLGFFRPALLLPEWMIPVLTPDQLRKIALHECEHLRRRDDWLNLLLQFALVASPLNPALLWLNRRIGDQRELACDAAVVASTGEPIAYAACLAHLAEQRMQQRSHLRLALAAWQRRSELEQRIHALLQQPAQWNARQSGIASAFAGVVLLGLSAGFAHAPQFVRVAETAASPVATVVPAAAILPRTISPALPAMRMVPVSYTVKPPEIARRRQRRTQLRKATLHTPVLRDTLAAPAPRKNSQAAGYILRTSTAVQPGPRLVQTIQYQEAPVRIVPAELSTPYVAVPLASGWLLIEL